MIINTTRTEYFLSPIKEKDIAEMRKRYKKHRDFVLTHILPILSVSFILFSLIFGDIRGGLLGLFLVASITIAPISLPFPNLLTVFHDRLNAKFPLDLTIDGFDYVSDSGELKCKKSKPLDYVEEIPLSWIESERVCDAWHSISLEHRPLLCFEFLLLKEMYEEEKGVTLNSLPVSKPI